MWLTHSVPPRSLVYHHQVRVRTVEEMADLLDFVI